VGCELIDLIVSSSDNVKFYLVVASGDGPVFARHSWFASNV
jgi:hypothetical protein